MKKLILGMTLGLLLVGGGTASAMPKYEPYCLFSACGGVSEDGKRAIFTFDEPLDMLYPGSGPDMVYERSGGQTRALVKFLDGKRRPVRLISVSEDARVAVVQTRAPLTREDGDGFSEDYYAIEAGRPRLLTWDPADPASRNSKDTSTQFEALSRDGKTVYLKKYTGAKPFPCLETWARTEDSMTKLPIPCQGSHIVGLSGDGSIFTSEDHLETTYRTQANVRTRLFDFDSHSWSQCGRYSEFGDASADGNTTLFSSDFRITPDDVDGLDDIYIRRPDGSYELLTQTSGPAERPDCAVRPEIKALGLSGDGSRALYATTEAVSPLDRDSSTDVYLHVPGREPQLVTTGPADDHAEVRNPALGDAVAGWATLAWRIDASDDLSVIAFDSTERLVPEDTDDSVDVYLWHDGETELVSTGPNADGAEVDAKLLSISNDGSRVAFSTMESLVPVDMDDRMDIYSRTTGQIGRATDEGTGDGAVTPASLTATASAKRKRRTTLVSAESIAPRMKLVGKPRVSGRRAWVRLRCPRTEQTGPCRGTVRFTLKGRKGSRGKGRFRIKAGKTGRVKVKLSRRSANSRTRATLRIKAWDRLGNTWKANRRISLR